MEAKGSRARIAFALLCGLAVCCSVMYITTDGAEVMHEDEYVGAGFDLDFPRHDAGPNDPKVNGQEADPRSIESVDVKKAGTIITNTPDGRVRLKTYLEKVESMIAKEVAGRRADITAIRAKMAKNMMFNAAARKTMKKALLAKMAKNAKIAKDELAKNMRKVQAKFAAQAKLANKRWHASIRRSRKTREIMRKNKREGAHDLKMAVLNQQKQLAALASATNAHIKKTEKSIAANGAQIKANAKAAADALHNAMHAFNKKMANAEAEAKKGRSKLAAQAASQDKAFRNMANNKIREMVAHTNAEFQKVQKTMAKNRHHADLELKTASTRMNAALAASKALQDKRFKKTVKDINAAKSEANERVTKAKNHFKTNLLHLTTTVRHQVAGLKSAQAKLAHTVTKNRLDQAQVNRNVHAELGRMVALGNERYEEHLKKDKELHALIKKNEEHTKREMKRMSDTFTEALGKIRSQMKKDREHAANSLKASTDGLYATMATNLEAQGKVNVKLAAATKRAAKDAKDALDAAKLEFTSKLAKMHAVAVKAAKKQEKKIQALTGTVAENALKDAKGRRLLKKQQKANKLEIQHAITQAIDRGEQRALQIEKRQKDINDKTRAKLSQRIDTEVDELRKQTQKSLYSLSLETKAARAMMRKEVEAALKNASDKAREELKTAVKWATGRFAQLDALLESNNKASATEREALKARVAADKAHAQKKLQEAVDKQSRAFLALETETHSKIKKTNKSLEAHAEQMEKNADVVAAKIKTDVATLTNKIAAAKRSANSGLAAAGAASVKRYENALSEVTSGLEAAEKKSEQRFGKLYKDMAKNRKAWDEKYATSINDLNEALAQQAALENEQFTKKIPEAIAKLKRESRERVDLARKSMTTSIVTLTSVIKEQESKLQGEIAVVSAEVVSNAAAQARVNAKVKQELEAIEKASNSEHSTSKRFHKEIKVKVDANKAAAAEEVKALAQKTKLAVGAMRGKLAADRQQAAIQLTETTKKLYTSLAKHEADQAEAAAGLQNKLGGAKAATAAKLKAAKKTFAAKVNTLTNLITSNNGKFEDELRRVTGVVHDYKKSSADERALIKDQVAAMDADLSKAITRAIQLGEAKAKAVEEEAMEGTEFAKRELLTTMSEQIEDMADSVFKLVQGNRKVIADNYLSLSAYAASSADALQDYVTKGKGRNLASVGDLLETIAQEADTKVGKAEGVGAGADKIPLIFSGEEVTIANPINQINWLVDAYTKTLTTVQARWPSGLGKYLLSKVEANMQEKGILEVDKVEGKAGNYVFVNAHAVGLSSKLSDFEKLAVHMNTYQHVLSKMTASASKKHKSTPAEVVVNPPEWQGN